MRHLFNLRSSLFNSQVLFNSVIPLRTVITLSYNVHGDGSSIDLNPPVFIFHGILADNRQWRGVGKTINRVSKREVYVVDLRNHGKSPKIDSHKYSDLGSDILELMKKFNMQEASLIGHGMGGMAAMSAALMSPESVAGLLVIESSPVSTPTQTDTIQKILVAMKKIRFNKTKTEETAQAHVRKTLKDFDVQDYLMDNIISNIKKNPDGTFGWYCNVNVLANQHDHWKSFPFDDMQKNNKTYDGPTLFIGGKRSNYIPPDDLNNIQKLFPKASIQYITNAGYNVHMDAPEIFYEMAISFLKTNVYRKSVIK